MILLKNRGVIKIAGEDSLVFLNNLVTNEITNANEEYAVFAALLSPQGKYLFDFFILKTGENEFLLDCNHADELAPRLNMFKLRAKVKIENLSNELAVFSGKFGNLTFQDPRNIDLGNRSFAPIDTITSASFDDYEKLRIGLGIPELSFDLLRDKDFVLEGLLDELNGVDFHKGCYTGQEMTSRMKRRGTIKQKLCRIDYIAEAPKYDTPIMASNLEIGRTRSMIDGKGIALIRFDRWQEAQSKGHKLVADNSEIIIRPPQWQNIILEAL